MGRPPHVVVLGLRGFPGVQGGVEAHAQNLLPLLAQRGFRVTALARAPRLAPDHPAEWRGVRMVKLWAPRAKALEAIVHTALGVLYAGVVRPDILHFQAIGPALLAPVARLLGLRVVVTHHGPDYDRQKWRGFARLVLRGGEAAGMRCAHRRIAISATIRQLVAKKYRRDSALIPNGVTLPDLPAGTATLERLGLEPGRYVLNVGRLVPEKRQDDLIRAFAASALPGWKLVLVGGADHADAYTCDLDRLAADTQGVVSAGFRSGGDLAELYAHAGIFVLPSSHEGLPIALLEALSYGVACLASDIPANLELGLPGHHYVPLGDIAALARRLEAVAAAPPPDRATLRAWVAQRYDWHQAADATAEVYRSVLAG